MVVPQYLSECFSTDSCCSIFDSQGPAGSPPLDGASSGIPRERKLPHFFRAPLNKLFSNAHLTSYSSHFILRPCSVGLTPMLMQHHGLHKGLKHQGYSESTGTPAEPTFETAREFLRRPKALGATGDIPVRFTVMPTVQFPSSTKSLLPFCKYASTSV